MPHFAFVARTRVGKPEKGTVEAANPDEAVSILQARDLVVVSVNEHKPGPVMLGLGSRSHLGVKPSDLVVLARSLAAMTEAGLPLLRGMEIVAEQTRSRRLTATLTQMIRDIRGGSTLRDAVAKHPAVFSPFWISLIETGEASGQLTKALEQIALHLEKSGAVRRKVVSAMIYPSILVAAAVGAIATFTLKIIPTFSELYTSFGAELPVLTRVMVSFSTLMRRYAPLALLALLILGFLFYSILRTPQGRWQFDRMKLRMPIFGALFQAIAAQEFASNLGTLLRAGVPILHAMDIVIATAGNKLVASVLDHMRNGVKEGRPLAEPLSRTDIFPPMVAQMIAVGEQTGKLSQILEEISQFYEEQVETTVERLMTMMEPAILIGMGLVIGILVISMYLPIFQMSQIVR